jgi:hypothetical protein
MPKNPVRAARQASRQAIRTARTSNRQDARTINTAKKVDKIVARTATKVNKIKAAAPKPVAKTGPAAYKPSAPTVKLPDVAKPKLKSIPDGKGIIKDMPAETRKAAPVKKKTTPRATPRPAPAPAPKPAPAPAPAPAQKKGLADGSMSKSAADYSAREIAEGIYNTGKTIKDEAYNKAKAIVDDAYNTAKRKAGYLGDAFDAAWNFGFKQKGGSVKKKYNNGGRVDKTDMKPRTPGVRPTTSSPIRKPIGMMKKGGMVKGKKC